MVPRSARFLSLVLVLILVWAGAPIATSAPDSPGVQYPAPGPKRKLVFGMPVAPPNVVHTPVALAKELGFTEKFNIDLEIKNFEGSTRALTAAITGDVDLGTIDCLTAYGNGVPLVGFHGPAPKLPVAMVARDTLKSLKDLKGKRIGMSSAPGGFIDRMNRAALAAGGLKAEDVTIVQTTSAGRVPALISGQTDTAVFHYEQVSKLLRTQRGYALLFDLNKALPSYQYHVHCGLKANVLKNREALIDLTAATIVAIRYAYNHRRETVRLLAQLTGAEEADAGYAYARIITACVWARNLGLDRDRLNWSIDYEHQGGDLRNKYDINQLLDMRMANEALRRAGGPMAVPAGCS